MITCSAAISSIHLWSLWKATNGHIATKKATMGQNWAQNHKGWSWPALSGNWREVVIIWEWQEKEPGLRQILLHLQVKFKFRGFVTLTQIQSHSRHIKTGETIDSTNLDRVRNYRCRYKTQLVIFLYHFLYSPGFIFFFIISYLHQVL